MSHPDDEARGSQGHPDRSLLNPDSTILPDRGPTNDKDHLAVASLSAYIDVPFVHGRMTAIADRGHGNDTSQSRLTLQTHVLELTATVAESSAMSEPRSTRHSRPMIPSSDPVHAPHKASTPSTSRPLPFRAPRSSNPHMQPLSQDACLRQNEPRKKRFKPYTKPMPDPYARMAQLDGVMDTMMALRRDKTFRHPNMLPLGASKWARSRSL
ncbi:hypothetical protein SeMB42_g02705 [Synchytrium endobioticum]|uniref:Uncharacterized protein n=1 Tax=Synchytrium endobioticum TaxID=286115 RepID=A0A507DCQ3_9FUNG|nr:hypothetical protein SeMB42_g02705 [Synchytrium endobioticum]